MRKLMLLLALCLSLGSFAQEIGVDTLEAAKDQTVDAVADNEMEETPVVEETQEPAGGNPIVTIKEIEDEDNDKVAEETEIEIKIQDFDEKDDDEIMTLFKTTSHGGLGGVNVMYSIIDGKDAIYIGGRGGWIIGHGLSIGFGGCGYFNATSFNENDIRNSLAGGHGGMYLEPILFPRLPVHLSLPLFIGAGGISYLEYSNDENYKNDPGIPTYSDSYFIAEPGVELELNMLKHFRLCFGAYYTYTYSIDLPGIEGQPFGNDLLPETLKYGITLKFGDF